MGTFTPNRSRSLCQIGLVLFTALLPASEPVYRYEPHVVNLTGVLDTRIYPGSPNYESVKSGDRPKKIWLIRLPHPISMEPDPEPASFEGETGIKEIHVILTDLKDEKSLKEHRGETVIGTITGISQKVVKRRPITSVNQPIGAGLKQLKQDANRTAIEKVIHFGDRA